MVQLFRLASNMMITNTGPGGEDRKREGRREEEKGKETERKVGKKRLQSCEVGLLAYAEAYTLHIEL